MGVGETILDGERARPLGNIGATTRRECRFGATALLVAEVRGAEAAAEPDFAPGISRTFSFRPVVGSVVNPWRGQRDVVAIR